MGFLEAFSNFQTLEILNMFPVDFCCIRILPRGHMLCEVNPLKFAGLFYGMFHAHLK